MRRSTRLGLIVAVVLLIVLGGAYTVFWFIAADRIKQEAPNWIEAARAEKLDVSWQAIGVSGYPFAFRIELSAPILRGAAANPPVELRAPTISGETRPWAYRDWHLAAVQGIEATIGNPAVPMAKIHAEGANGSVSIGSEGGAEIWLELRRPSAEPGAEPEHRILADALEAWLSVPARPAREHTDRNIAVAASLRNVSLPLPPPLAAPVDASFGATLMGTIPNGTPRQAAEAWRRSGGTLEIDHVDFAWGGINISGSGTMSLDDALQPTGAFSGTIEGYDPLIAALTAAGNIKANDARVVRMALGVMSKPGPNGKPAITAPFTLQNSQMYLGPARLGLVPRLNWE